jgi:hypothetical protein
MFLSCVPFENGNASCQFSQSNLGDTYVPEKEGKLFHSREENVEKVFYRIKTGSLGSPPGRPIYCASPTTVRRALCGKPPH